MREQEILNALSDIKFDMPKERQLNDIIDLLTSINSKLDKLPK